MIKFTYYGEAVGKGRPRITRRGSFVHTYTPEKTRVFEENILLAFVASTEEQMPVYPKGTSLRVKVLIGCSIPKSYSKKKQAQCREGIIVPDKKPDIDNILKSIFDALQGGYAFDDDSQIVEIYAEKKYAEKPFVEVEIDEFKRA